MYFKMIENMLQMTKIQYGVTLECKGEALKKVIFHAQINAFRQRIYFVKSSRNVVQRKNGLIRTSMKFESVL